MNINLVKLIKAHYSEEEVLALTEDLIRAKSFSGIQGQETEAAKIMDKFFKKEDIDSKLVHVKDGRYNLIAVLKGSGKGKRLLLTGHTDTVPSYDGGEELFCPRIIGQRLYGRGAVDMKGALACMAIAMAAIKRSGIKLSGDIVFAGVIDEEHKSLGTINLIKSGFKADCAVVGEPTNFDICTAHKGLQWFEIKFKGISAHGGLQDEAVNAIQLAYYFIDHMERHYKNKISGRKTSFLGASSINYGLISGGTQPSTVPGECVLQFDRRWVPEEVYQDIEAEFEAILEYLKQKHKNFRYEFKIMEESIMEGGYIHMPMNTDNRHPMALILKNNCRKVLDENKKMRAFAAWTDGGLLSFYGKIPTIVFGPGDLRNAHTKEEHIQIKDLTKAVLIYALSAAEYCGYAEGEKI